MVHTRVKKAHQVVEEKQWIFKIDLELNTTSKPKVAFLSGLERSYYPEDPGFSKFGLVFQTNGFEDDTPPCTFIPHPVGFLSKPVSNKGYGIGGLSGQRFAALAGVSNPSPDKYQPELVKPILQSKRKQVPEAEDIYRLASTDPLFLRQRQRLEEQRQLQCLVAFGTLKEIPRFGQPPTFNTAGVGSYNLSERDAPSLLVRSSFGSSPVIRQESTEVKCGHGSEEKCIECGRVLHVCDFYRTRFSVRVPLPISRPVETLDKNFPKGKHHVNLCNFCYYHASLGENINWPKKKLPWLFKKTRTCAFIHDHDSLSEYVHRADCKTFRKLQRKEAILSKYYADRVAESIPAEEFHY